MFTWFVAWWVWCGSFGFCLLAGSHIGCLLKYLLEFWLRIERLRLVGLCCVVFILVVACLLMLTGCYSLNAVYCFFGLLLGGVDWGVFFCYCVVVVLVMVCFDFVVVLRVGCWLLLLLVLLLIWWLFWDWYLLWVICLNRAVDFLVARFVLFAFVGASLLCLRNYICFLRELGCLCLECLGLLRLGFVVFGLLGSCFV